MITLCAYYYTPLMVCVGSCLLGFVAGVVGTFVVLSRKSLLGDMIAHASLPGIALVFLWTHTRNVGLLMVGGCFSGLCAVALEYLLVATTRLPYDAILGMLLSVSFGLGLVGITYAQKTEVGNQLLLQKLVFGNAALLSREDIIMMVVVGLGVIVVLRVFWRGFVASTFDEHGAVLMGWAVARLKVLLLMLFVVVILLGLQTMGAILMSTLLVAPATSVRPWVRSVGALAWYAGIFGSVAALLGTVLSCSIDHVPTGPVVVIILTVGVIGSLLVHYGARGRYDTTT